MIPSGTKLGISSAGGSTTLRAFRGIRNIRSFKEFVMVRMAIPTIPSSGFCFQAPGKPPTKQAAMALRFHLSYLLSKAWDVHGWIIGIQIN